MWGPGIIIQSRCESFRVQLSYSGDVTSTPPGSKTDLDLAACRLNKVVASFYTKFTSSYRTGYQCTVHLTNFSGIQFLNSKNQCCWSGSGAGSRRIWNEFETKLIWQTDKNMAISQKNAQFKKYNSFFPKIPLQSLHLVVVCNLTHLQDGDTKVMSYVSILEKVHVGSETI